MYLACDYNLTKSILQLGAKHRKKSVGTISKHLISSNINGITKWSVTMNIKYVLQLEMSL